jgi:hypothetical protein
MEIKVISKYPLLNVYFWKKMVLTESLRIRRITENEKERWLSNRDLDFYRFQKGYINNISYIIESYYRSDNNMLQDSDLESGLTNALLNIIRLIADEQNIYYPFTEISYNNDLNVNDKIGQVYNYFYPSYSITKFDEMMCDHLRCLFSKYLNNWNQKMLNTPMHRWWFAKRNLFSSDALIDVWIGLEAIFLTKDEKQNKGSIASKRCSLFIYKDELRQKKAKEMLQKSYRIRNCIMHTNDEEYVELLKNDHIGFIYLFTLHCLRKSILKLIEYKGIFKPIFIK